MGRMRKRGRAEEVEAGARVNYVTCRAATYASKGSVKGTNLPHPRGTHRHTRTHRHTQTQTQTHTRGLRRRHLGNGQHRRVIREHRAVW